MSFYLLKSNIRREKCGDILLDKNEVESIACRRVMMEDTENEIYKMIVSMKSRDTWVAFYKTEKETKEVIKDILGDRISDKSLEEFYIANLD